MNLNAADDTASRALWLEIGCEELPPAAARAAREQLPLLLTAALEEARLAPGRATAFATPRRLAVWFDAVPPYQAPEVKTVTGPPRDRAFDGDGRLTDAGKGFLKKWGLDDDAAHVVKVGKGEYLVVDVTSPRLAVPQVLEATIPTALAKLTFAKTMRWPQSDTPFPRPVRWLTCLWGDDVIPFAFAGLTAGGFSWGHRALAPREVNMLDAGRGGALDLPTLLEFYQRELGVLLDAEDRRRRVVSSLPGIGVTADYFAHPRADIQAAFTRVLDAAEMPSLVTGAFDARHLAMPDEVVEAALLGYLNLFPVRGADGELTPRFFAVHDARAEAIPNVRAGLERVLKARLTDALYFWEVDSRTPLTEMAKGLQGVLFAAGAGTVAEKASRLAKLCDAWTEDRGDGFTPFVPLGADEREHLRRAAALCKADLVSQMVREKEFTHLQGRMGRLCALAQGEPAAVADAVGEHYAPAGADDPLPASRLGRVLSLADKLDTLTALFAAGHKPTGNKDPSGLRRAAVGACRLWLEDEDDLFAKLPIERALAGAAAVAASAGVTEEAVAPFIYGRLAQIFLDQGYSDDMVNAVIYPAPEIQLPLSAPRDLGARLRTLKAFYEKRNEYIPLAIAFKRTINILRQARKQNFAWGEVNVAFMQEEEEKLLWSTYEEIAPRVKNAYAAGDYDGALSSLAQLRPAVDAFFDGVMVMCDDDALRNNRLAVMSRLTDLFLSFADFTKLRGEEVYA